MYDYNLWDVCDDVMYKTIKDALIAVFEVLCQQFSVVNILYCNSNDLVMWEAILPIV